MPINKKEVCGKPTQYNLQTCEYDWKYLPDTHFVIQQNAKRRGQFSLQPSAPVNVASYTPRAPSPQKYPQRENVPAVASPSTSSPLMWVSPGTVTRGPQPSLLPWSHDELRQIVYANQSAAQQSYLWSGG
ncbi:hypothetical protein TraAM80_05802 [Trypanosoma rangeli]|uniref:Uncharacterized protein n=1 Tax=Trypanosoma rangeli TaxID=5698 RepID=A0A3R7KBY3_TRYRA|nr:uncharacterized protein TraAM80_05802 [Trypanosoma rangeli]RNF03453.1 hypothetical protein TraAM80_05802 [Trypanosoma rangeli]|eukprot:RNF03453.1 hypothetical protein TraAM80_05802 [Trypanosoma rangeli]